MIDSGKDNLGGMVIIHENHRNGLVSKTIIYYIQHMFVLAELDKSFSMEHILS